jgi:hypothetical protein
MGQIAAKHLIGMLKSPATQNNPKKIIINSELIIRGSSQREAGKSF